MQIVLAHSHPDTLGGGERALLETARGLSVNHAVRLLVGRVALDRSYSGLRLFERQAVARPAWLTLRVAADAIVAHTFGANLLSLRNGKRVAYWVHSLRGRFLEPGNHGPLAVARRALDQAAVRRSHLLVANSRFTADRLAAIYGRPADAIAYPGVDLELYTPGEPADYAVSVGRLAPEKGLEALVAAWRNIPDVPLLLVGAGEPAFVRRLRSRAPPNVRFGGPMDSDGVARVLRSAAMAIIAAEAEEFGIAPLEAMAAGLPVVGLRGGALPEVVAHDETGLLVESVGQIATESKRLWYDAPARRRLGTAARDRAAQFSWESTVTVIEGVCVTLASGRHVQSWPG